MTGRGLWSRRRFTGALAWLAGGLGPLIGGCTAGPENAPASAPTNATRTGWRWEIRWAGARPARPDESGPNPFRLRIDGLVRTSKDLSLGDLRRLPAVAQRSRMRCVEGWSAPAEWTGVRGSVLLELAEPLPEATHVRFIAADGYDTTLPIELARHERTLVAYQMDGRPLPDDHGYPLRAVVPAHYGYKGAKAVVRIELMNRTRLGFWEQRGYGDDGAIAAGQDRPLDLGGIRSIAGGEITDY